jgi:hypothetical protein
MSLTATTTAAASREMWRGKFSRKASWKYVTDTQIWFLIFSPPHPAVPCFASFPFSFSSLSLFRWWHQQPTSFKHACYRYSLWYKQQHIQHTFSSFIIRAQDVASS